MDLEVTRFRACISAVCSPGTFLGLTIWSWPNHLISWFSCYARHIQHIYSDFTISNLPMWDFRKSSKKNYVIPSNHRLLSHGKLEHNKTCKELYCIYLSSPEFLTILLTVHRNPRPQINHLSWSCMLYRCNWEDGEYCFSMSLSSSYTTDNVWKTFMGKIYRSCDIRDLSDWKGANSNRRYSSAEKQLISQYQFVLMVFQNVVFNCFLQNLRFFLSYFTVVTWALWLGTGSFSARNRHNNANVRKTGFVSHAEALIFNLFTTENFETIPNSRCKCEMPKLLPWLWNEKFLIRYQDRQSSIRVVRKITWW